MKKLTLSADEEVIEQAKRIAEEAGTSVSSMFERIIRSLARRRRGKSPLGKLTKRATGIVRLPRGKSERDVLSEALAEKHGLK